MEKVLKFFAILLLFVVVCFVVLIAGMYGSYNYMKRYITAEKIITVQLFQNDSVNLHDNYRKSLEEVVVHNNVDELAEFVITINEGYESIFVATYVSNEDRWHKMQIRDAGQGQYIVDYIQTDDENVVITYRIETKDNEGALDEFYFSYCNR